MRVPIRPKRGSWPAGFERRMARFIWADPRVILDDSAAPEAFRTAMNALQFGETIKITRENRHPVADRLLVDNLDLTDAAIVDIGASDGTTAVDLIRKLPAFKSYVIADLFLTIAAVQISRHVLFFDHSGRCVLVSGPRCVAWPNRSRLIRLLYAPLIRVALRRSGHHRDVLLLNPATRSLISSDDRVTHAVHDVFEPWPKPAPDVIKVANLLRRLYFSDTEICRALRAILASLDEGGHLLMVDNARIDGVGPRAGLYRRTGAQFAAVARTDQLPEIDDLIGQVRLDGTA